MTREERLETALRGLACRACGYRIGEDRPGSDRCACTEAREALAEERAASRRALLYPAFDAVQKIVAVFQGLGPEDRIWLRTYCNHHLFAPEGWEQTLEAKATAAPPPAAERVVAGTPTYVGPGAEMAILRGGETLLTHAACRACGGSGIRQMPGGVVIKCYCGGTGRAPTDGGARSPGAGRGEEGRDGR